MASSRPPGMARMRVVRRRRGGRRCGGRRRGADGRHREDLELARPLRAERERDAVADLHRCRPARGRRQEAHRHRAPLERRDRRVRQHDLVLRDRFHAALAAMLAGDRGRRRRCLWHGGCGRGRRARSRYHRVGCPEPRRRALQARVGVDQELAGHDHLLPRFEALADLRHAVRFRAGLDVDRRNLPSPSATITTVRLPVAITASDGTTVTSAAPAGTKSTDAYIPGTR